MPPFSIHFVYGKSQTAKEDTLHIYQDDNGYAWSFSDYVKGSKHIIRDCTEGEVLDRLDNLLRIVGKDEEAAAMLQVDVPGYPTVIFKSAAVRKNLPVVVEALRLTLDRWPAHKISESCAEPCAPGAPSATRRWPSRSSSPAKHLYFD